MSQSQNQKAAVYGFIFLCALLAGLLAPGVHLITQYWWNWIGVAIFSGIPVFAAFVMARIFSNSPATKQVRLITYNAGTIQMAHDVVDRWHEVGAGKLVSSWAMLQDASPIPFRGKALCRRSGRYENTITIDVEYSFLKRGTLTCIVSQLPNNQIKLNFQWAGSEHALHNTSSDDYKLLDYLLESIATEFHARGCHVPGASLFGGKGGKRQSPYQTLQNWYQNHNHVQGSDSWWRSYVDGGEDGTSVTQESWPSPQEFSEAIQNPHISLVDPDLKQSKPHLNALGLPNVASGAFASVFKLSQGENHWAVRCFNTKPTDQHERYQAISRFILADDLSYTVDFNYLEKGVKHNGYYFPILKMNWVAGTPLDSYVRTHLNDREKIERIRAEFRIMLEQLRKNGIAHGDLQHGNILVEDDSLYLVDYDGMYVPELQGRHSNEIGHRNYQHPGRRAEHFGPYLDNFAAWLIDVSLFCISEDPSLWHRFSGGDECLLFRQEDLVNPDDSALFNALRSHQSAEIRNSAEWLYSLLHIPLEDIPYLTLENEQSKDQPVAIQTKQLENTGR